MVPHDLHNRLSFLRGVSPRTQADDTAFVSQAMSGLDPAVAQALRRLADEMA